MKSVTDLDEPDSPNGKEVFTPETRAEWREWLGAHPDRSEGVWLVYAKKSSDLEGPRYDDLVEESLCFGWIDSQSRRVDDDRTMQWYSPRRKGGIWSAPNKERIERLARHDLITPAGWAAIDKAKADGSWSQADEVDAMIMPPDLQHAFDAAPDAQIAYQALADSAKRLLLWQIKTAKRPATRDQRIRKTIEELGSVEPPG